MSNQKFFTISGLPCVMHTPETEKIWQSWPENKSDHGRENIIRFAETKGFVIDQTKNQLSDIAFNAFLHLLDVHPGATKSWIIKQAILFHSE